MDTFNPQDLASVMYSLHLVADHLFELLPEDVENSLSTYDMFIGLAPQFRGQAAQLLRETAAGIQDPERRERVLRAADAVAKGEPCALAEDGSTRQQASHNTITLDEWERQKSNILSESSSSAPPASPGQAPAAEAPDIPHLDIWDFFPGLAVRIAQSFRDFDGDDVQAGELLHVVNHDYFPYDGGHTLTFKEKVIRLAEIAPENEPVMENWGNAYFEPVPDAEAMLACFQLIHQQWNFLLKEFPEKINVEHASEVRAEIDACARWLKAKGDRGPAPVCLTAPWAAAAFPHDDRHTTNLAFRITFLFAGIARTA